MRPRGMRDRCTGRAREGLKWEAHEERAILVAHMAGSLALLPDELGRTEGAVMKRKRKLLAKSLTSDECGAVVAMVNESLECLDESLECLELRVRPAYNGAPIFLRKNKRPGHPENKNSIFTSVLASWWDHGQSASVDSSDARWVLQQYLAID